MAIKGRIGLVGPAAPLPLHQRGVLGKRGEASQPAESSPSRASAADHQPQRFSARAVLPDSFGLTKRPFWTSPFRMNGGQAVTIALPLIAGTAGLIAADQDAARLVA